MAATKRGDSSPRTTINKEHGTISFEDLERMYLLRKYSIPFVLGILIAIVGFIGFILITAVPHLQLPAFFDPVTKSLEAFYLGMILAMVFGLVLALLDYLKRTFFMSAVYEIRRSFVLYMHQEKLFPRDMEKKQFKFLVVPQGRNHFAIYFTIGIPYKEIKRHIEGAIASKFEADDTSIFSPNPKYKPRRPFSYKYRFDLVLTYPEKAYKNAGEHRG